MCLWSPQMRRMENFSSLRKLRNKKPSLRNRRRIHPVTPDFGVYNRISEDVEERLARHRKMVEPEVVGESDSEGGDAWPMDEDSSEEEEEETDDEEIERHCGMIRQRAQERKDEEMEVMEVEEEGRSESESEEYRQ